MKSDAQIGGALHPLPPANTLKELEARLAKMDSERDAIQARIRVLRESAASVETDVARPVPSKTFPNAPLTKASALADRIRFLLDLFHARRDVYAERFESRKTGKTGYQPVCANLWRRPLCQNADYGHLIVDECHHVSARTFELVARRCRTRYVTGLSATVVRQDGHHPIMIMQCGPIRFRTDARQDADLRPFTHSVHVRRTGFQLAAPQVTSEGVADETPIQDAFRQLTEDEARNALIAEQALSALREGRSPVLLTERRKHLEWFQVYLQHKVERLVVLHGGMGQKKRRAAWDVLQATTASGTPRLVLATGKYLGEGFDDARLDALLLAMPISWKGTVAQYAGRLHRLYTGKQAVVIYDFVDDLVPVLARMFERRKRGYASLGYSIVESPVPDSVRCPANAAST